MTTSRTEAAQFLISSQLVSGGWGYEVGLPAVVEPTAAAVLALRGNEGAVEALERAVRWLLTCQNQDGGWGYSQNDPESNWQTAWAVLALERAGYKGSEIERGILWLASEEALQYTDSSLLSEGTRIAKIDFSIRGWPWLPTQASWVEPTALAMLALETAKDQPDVRNRLTEAVRYLKDRRVPGGGWNVGNPVMFSSVLPARAHPTAWSLLALMALSSETILPEDYECLKTEMQRDGGNMALAWGLLAIRAAGQDAPAARDLLIAAQQVDGSWDHNPYLTAVAWMALGSGW